MAKTYYIYSTMSADNCYAAIPNLVKGTKALQPRGLAQAKSKILIAGRANVVHDKTRVLSKAIKTELTEAEYNSVKDNDMFKRHLERGFLKIEEKEFKVEDVAKDMKAKDKGAQKTLEDYKKDKKAS